MLPVAKAVLTDYNAAMLCEHGPLMVMVTCNVLSIDTAFKQQPWAISTCSKS